MGVEEAGPGAGDGHAADEGLRDGVGGKGLGQFANAVHDGEGAGVVLAFYGGAESLEVVAEPELQLELGRLAEARGGFDGFDDVAGGLEAACGVEEGGLDLGDDGEAVGAEA